jgi:WD40 repeat protein
MIRRFSAIAGLVFPVASVVVALQGSGEKTAKPDVVFRGHSDAVYAVAFSPDGKSLVTASFDHTLKLWETATGREVKTYGGATGHTKQVISVAFNQDGSMIASGSTDNTLKVWDVPINAPIRSFKSSDAVQAVALSPDGLKLAIGGKDGSLHLVAPTDFKELVKFQTGHRGAITGVAFSANGLLLASVGLDRMLRFWNVANGQLLATIGAHTAGVNAVAINSNNTAAYTVADDGFLKFWSLPPVPPKTLPGASPGANAGSRIRALAMTVDNNAFYAGGDDCTVRHFTVAGPKEVRSLTGPSSGVSSVATHPANAFIAAGTLDGKAFLWNNTDAKMVTSWLAHTGAIQSVQVHPQGQQLMTAGADGMVKFWALPPILPRTLTHPDVVLATAASSDGRKLFTGSADKLVRIWDTTKQAMEKQFAGHSAPVTAVAVSSNLQILASGSADNTIRLWNQATAKESDVVLAHAGPLTALSINAPGTQMLSASEDGTVKLWALPLVVPKLFTHSDQITSVVVTPDGGKILTGGNDKTVRLWNLTNGAKERDYPGPTLPILHVAVSNNGATIAAAAADKTVTLWNVGDAKLMHKLALPAVPQVVAFSSDSQSVFVGLTDNSIKQIKIADGKEIRTLPSQHKAEVVGLALSPKGDLLFSASADKMIQSWALPEGTPKGKFEHVAPIVAMALSKDGTRLAALSAKMVKVWNVADGKEVATLKVAADAKGISLSPDNTRILVAGSDKLARIYELDGTLRETLPHDGPVHGVAFVDSRRVVTAGADKLARLWTSSLLWQRQHPGPVRQAVFTPKGDLIVSAADKSIKLWNAADGKEVKSLTNESPITHFGLSADAAKIATADADKNVRMWTVADAKPGAAIVLPAAVQSLTLSPNGQRIAIGLTDGPNNVIRVHDVGLAKEIQVFADHTAALKSLQFLADGRTLVSASADKTARLLDVGVVSALAAHPAGPMFAQYHNTGAQLVTAGADRTVKLWDLAKANVLKTFGPVADPVSAIAFSRDFTKIGVAAGKKVLVWNIADSKEVVTLTHPEDVHSLSFSQDGARIATGAADKQTRLWEVATGKELQFFAQDDPVDAVIHLPNNLVISAAGKVARLDSVSIVRQVRADAGPVHGLALIPANTHVLTAGGDKTAKLWNLTTGVLERSFPGATAPLRSVAISKNSQLLAAGGADQVVRVYQFADAKEIGSLKIAGEVRAVSFTPNNLALVAASSAKTLQAVQVPFAPGQPQAKEFLNPAQSFTAADALSELVIAPDSSTIYSAGQDKAMHVWKLASPAPTRNFAYGTNVDAVAFQPNGTLLAGAGHDGKIRFYDLVKNVQVKEINAHIRLVQKNNVPQPVYSLTFSLDGKQLLSSSYDNSIKLWDVASGNMVREFKPYTLKDFEKGHQEPVYTAAFSPDGKFIASGSSGLERTIKIWSLDGNVVRDLANPNYKTAPMFPPASHPGAVTNLRFTKDGKYLISVGDAPGNKGFLAFWDWQAGKMVSSETFQLGVFYGLALAPDEKSLAVTAGNRDRKFASPDFNAAYLLKLPMGK